MNPHEPGFQEFIIHQMKLGDLEFWWDAYVILSGPGKIQPIKPVNKQTVKQRVQQWPAE